MNANDESTNTDSDVERVSLVATDYKGKWFVLEDKGHEDGYSFPREEINTEWVQGEGLREHVANCLYYGIPAYVGKDAALHARIEKLRRELGADETRLTTESSSPAKETGDL